MTTKTLYAISRHWHSLFLVLSMIMAIAGCIGWYEAESWKETLIFCTIASYWLGRADNRLGILLSQGEEEKNLQ